MIIKVKTTTEVEKEINFPYFTASEYGTHFGHYTETECIMVASDLCSVSILVGSNGLDCAEIKQHQFEHKFNEAMTRILALANQI